MDKKVESELVTIVKDLQKQVHFLEKKIDTLLKQSSGDSSSKRNYAKGPKSYNKSNYAGAKGPRSGAMSRPSANSTVYPKKNQEFNPDNRKHSDKPRKKQTTSTLKKRKA